MSTEFALIPEHQTFFNADGTLASGGQLFIYTAGSSTKSTTHRDSDGLVANTNPIVLDSLGQTPYGVYVATGTYKTILSSSTDTDPPATPIRTRDNISPRNDTTTTQDEWVASGLTPTFTSSTTFTLVGDQTSNFHVGRRLKTTDSSGTDYSTITVSAFTSLTTITIGTANLDSGLSAVSYALLSATSPSGPGAPSGLGTIGQSPVFSGAVTEWKSGAWTLLQTQTISGTPTSVDFTSLTADYPLLILVANNVLPTTDNDIILVQISQAASFKASGYLWHSALQGSAATTYNGATQATNATGFGFATSISFDADHGFSGMFFLPNPGGTTALQSAYWHAAHIGATDAHVNNTGSGHFPTSAAATDGLRIKPSGTNTLASGVLRLYGVS